MIPRLMPFRRPTRLGLAMLGALAVVTVPGLDSHAKPSPQSPVQKTMRDKILSLRGEIALLELEHETDGEILRQKLMWVPIVEQELLELRSEVRVKIPKDLPELNEETIEGFVALARGMSDEATADVLRQGLQVAKKTGDFEDAKKAMLTWLDTAKAVARSKMDEELDPLRKDFARHASELAGKRLDLEDAEREYCEARRTRRCLSRR